MTVIIVVTAMAVLTLIAAIISLAFFLEMFGWAWTGAPYVPIPKDALRTIPGVLRLTDRSVVYDLGCGDGRMLFELAKHSHAEFVGVEKAPLPYLLAKARSMISKQKNVRIIYGDIYTTPLERATHVYLYLFTELMHKLEPVLESKLNPGTRVVSCDFLFKNRKPDRTVPCGTEKNPHTLYVFEF